MPAITAADVTVTLNLDDFDRSPDGRIGMRTFPTVQFGDAILTYPALGVPMPALGKFGFHFAIKRAYIENPGNGYIYSFDRTNHKVRIWLGAARDAITIANHVGVAPTGNVAAPVFSGDALANITPTGNLANLAAGAFTGDALANITPAGNLANLVAAAHSHDLIVAGNGTYTFDASIGVNEANAALASNIANAVTVVGANAAKGGVANTTPGNSAGDFVGDALAPGTPTGNVANGTGAFVGDAIAPGTPTGNLTAPAFTGDVMANLAHTVTGGGAVAEAALAEMDNTVAPASVTLAMEMVGK
jgi:hypothetical protein